MIRFSSSSTPGPSWLGIGAQRSGTTWLTDLIARHPRVGIPVGPRGRPQKELQWLHKVPEGLRTEEAYQALFRGRKGQLLGEWTPVYLTALSVPAVARRVCQPDAPFFAVLRDPISRYASSMRLWVQRSETPVKPGSGAAVPWRIAPQVTFAQWCGMYADQLDAWARVCGRDRLVVLTYEEAVQQPQAACDQMWKAMGIDPVPIGDADEPTDLMRNDPATHAAAGKSDWQWPETMKEQLLALYRPQVRRLRDDWGLNTSVWPNFTDLQ